MRVYGQLVKARIQNIAGAVAASVKGLIYYRTDNDKIYVDDSALQQEIQQRQHLITNFRTDGPSTTNKAHLALCNNSANNGYEYNSGVIKDTKANITAMTRVAGYKYYATDEQLYYGDNGTGLITLALPVTPSFVVVDKTADYIILDNDGYSVINVSDTTATRTITLPTVSDNNNRVLIIKNISTQKGKIIVDGEGAETIDGLSTVVLDFQGAYVMISSNGSKWNIISHNITSYNKAYSLTVTGTNFSTGRAIGIPYRESLDSEKWRIKYNITGTLSVSTSTISLTVANTTADSTANNYQNSSASNTVSSAYSYWQLGTTTLEFVAGSSSSRVLCSGDIALDSKPSYVE